MTKLKTSFSLVCAVLYCVIGSTLAFACGPTIASVRQFTKQSIPFKFEQGTIMFAEAKLNGMNAVAVIDTGATLTTFNRASKILVGRSAAQGVSLAAVGGRVTGQLSLGNDVRFAGLHVDFKAIDVLPNLLPVRDRVLLLNA